MSQITVSTTQLQSLVNKANQCVGANKLLEITQCIGINCADNKITLYTTDGINNLRVSMPIDSDEELNVVVDAETFVKLINKITSETISLEDFENSLVVEGNGSYKIELKLDDDGNYLKYPAKTDSVSDTVGKITKSAVTTILSSLKASLSNNAGSVYVNYYVGDFVCATDRAMMGMFDYKVFDSDKFNTCLLNSVFVELLALPDSDITLQYDVDSQTLTAVSDDANFNLTTKINSGAEGFNVEALNKMMAIEQDSYCKIRKRELLDLLDRMSLFVGNYDDGAITLEFTQTHIRVTSLKSTGVEAVNYSESKNVQDKTIKININRLISQLKSYASDSVDLYYGSDLCIKLVDGDVTQIIALMR